MCLRKKSHIIRSAGLSKYLFCNMFLMGLTGKEPNSEQFAIEIYLLIQCKCWLHFCLDYSKTWWQFNCLRIKILFILWIYLEFCWKQWVLVFSKVLFITSWNSCSEASVCKTVMEKVSRQFWHPCGIKWHASRIHRLEQKFPRAILPSALVFPLSAMSLTVFHDMTFSTQIDTSPVHRQLLQLLSSWITKAHS